MGGEDSAIKSVLNGIHLYWTSVFVLPKGVIRKIVRMLSSFFWAGEIKK